MRNLVLLLVFGALLYGCGGISAHQTTLPDGTQGASINCDKNHNDWGDCYNKASEYCGGKYTVLEKNGSEQSFGYYNAGRPFFAGIPKRNIVVRCE